MEQPTEPGCHFEKGVAKPVATFGVRGSEKWLDLSLVMFGRDFFS